MEWLIDNWSLLVVLVCTIGACVMGCKKFIQSGKTNQIKKVKEWLLYACVVAEQEFGSGKGSLKLRYVYDKFVEKFGFIKYVVTFEEFSILVDDVLDSAIEFFENQGVEKKPIDNNSILDLDLDNINVPEESDKE
jgi:hypothetical protein